MIKIKKKISPVRQISLGFLIVILLGAFLLHLPISNVSIETSLIDSLFISTSAVCVTGLATVIPLERFTIFGQIVLIFLMQIGGLGFMTLIASLILRAKKRLSLSDKIAIQEALNKDSALDIHDFILIIIRYTFIIELIGFIILSIRFSLDFPLPEAMFKALFISISAFCNAGFDNLGATSLVNYAHDVTINLTVMALIIIGGIGFSVWFDLKNKIDLGQIIRKEITIKRTIKKLDLHTKLVLSITFLLLLSGTIIIFALEYNNSLAHESLFNKGLISLFQSTTLRTAGFATVDCSKLLVTTQLIMCLFMFIGGSPGGTAGGIKTTTFGVFVLTVVTILKNKNHVVIFKKEITKNIIDKCFVITSINFLILMFGIILLTYTEPFSFIEIVFEAVSAMGTVGLSLGITSSLTNFGKIVIISLMYIGRIGAITLILSIISSANKKSHEVAYPSGHIIIG